MGVIKGSLHSKFLTPDSSARRLIKNNRPASLPPTFLRFPQPLSLPYSDPHLSRYLYLRPDSWIADIWELDFGSASFPAPRRVGEGILGFWEWPVLLPILPLICNLGKSAFQRSHPGQSSQPIPAECHFAMLLPICAQKRAIPQANSLGSRCDHMKRAYLGRKGMAVREEKWPEYTLHRAP